MEKKHWSHSVECYRCTVCNDEEVGLAETLDKVGCTGCSPGWGTQILDYTLRGKLPNCSLPALSGSFLTDSFHMIRSYPFYIWCHVWNRYGATLREQQVSNVKRYMWTFHGQGCAATHQIKWIPKGSFSRSFRRLPGVFYPCGRTLKLPGMFITCSKVSWIVKPELTKVDL